MEAKLVGSKTFRTGDWVICGYRTPPRHQYWQSTVVVGIVQAPTLVERVGLPAFDEVAYCKLTNKTPVRYPWGVEYDYNDSLHPACEFMDEFPEYSYNMPPKPMFSPFIDNREEV